MKRQSLFAPICSDCRQAEVPCISSIILLYFFHYIDFNVFTTIRHVCNEVVACWVDPKNVLFRLIFTIWDNLTFLQFVINPILHRGGGGGRAQSARANVKDSYLRNEYCYINELW